jgi:hypothetical protein
MATERQPVPPPMQPGWAWTRIAMGVLALILVIVLLFYAGTVR